MLAAGTTMSLGSALGWVGVRAAERMGAMGSETLAVAIVVTCVGLAVAGVGAVRLTQVLQERAELEAQIEELQHRVSPPPAPIVLSYAWEL